MGGAMGGTQEVDNDSYYPDNTENHVKRTLSWRYMRRALEPTRDGFPEHRLGGTCCTLARPCTLTKAFACSESR